VDELVQRVAQRAGIPSRQAALAISTTLDYLMARLPSPLAGCIREQLAAMPGLHQPDAGNGRHR
jgi:hypothetical protein